MKLMKLAAVGAALLFAGTTAQAGETYSAVKARGFVQCGVNAGLPGFSQAHSKGVWKGIDVDMCRAVAAMVFGDASKFKATPLTTQQRFTALQSGEVDVLDRAGRRDADPVGVLLGRSADDARQVGDQRSACHLAGLRLASAGGRRLADVGVLLGDVQFFGLHTGHLRFMRGLG